MARKDVSYSIDLEELEKQLTTQREQEEEEAKEVSVRSTVFALGSDPRVFSQQQITAPDFYLVEVLKDRMDNPYVKLNWRVPRAEIDSGRVIGFNIYRRDVKIAISFNGIVNYDRVAFDKLSIGNKRTGKFSRDKKAMYNIKRGSIPLEVRNPNFAEIKNFEDSQAFSTEKMDDSPTYNQAEFERFFSDRKFSKIGYVDYTKFAAEEKNKFLVVKDRSVVNVSFKDKAVGFSETFEYYIECVVNEIGDAPRSDVVAVTVEDLNTAAPPVSLIAKQLNETEIQVTARMLPADKVAKVFFYRKASDEVFFELIAIGDNVNNVLNLIDAGVTYQKTYTYRVFCQSVHGNLSEPKEITVFSSVQKITPQSRSNSLRIPIISAVQDQNSNYVKVTIFPNDSNISVYELKRRDLTIFERSFAVPSALETNYGGTGWVANRFFVERVREPIVQDSSDTTSLKTKSSAKEIVFVDDTVQPGHIYQYRTRGYDLFENPSSYALAWVQVSGKKSIRTPINIKAEILRGFPYRIKITWDDDNLATLFSASELFRGDSSVEPNSSKILYKVQRRKLSEIVYESFPLTANKFVIDEVSTPDAILHNSKPSEDIYGKLPNNFLLDESLTIKDDIRRAAKFPAFLKENDVYFYRIIAISDNGEESNASEEFKISTLADLSDPVRFNAQVINAKVRPTSVRLSWEVEQFKARPDYWLIERKYDTQNDSFAVVGKAYLTTEFFDKNVELGNTYVYRIKSFDSIGRESGYFQARLTI